MSYSWKFTLDDRGYKEVPFEDYSKEHMLKNKYVQEYLSPSITNAKCGWDHCEYSVLCNNDNITEFAILYPDKENVSGRYYNVSGDSLGAIAETIWNGVFR